MELKPSYHQFQQDFESRNSLYLLSLEELNKLIVFCAENLETAELKNRNDVTIYYFYRQIAEAFNSILTLVRIGYARSSMIILRSMYEHCVTMAFFNNFPNGLKPNKANQDTVEKFFDYYHITQYKQFNKLKESYDGDLSDDEFKYIFENYESVKAKFEIPDCAKCKTTKVNHRWSKLDIVAMAKKVGLDKNLTFFGYQTTLSYAHPSSDSMQKRTEINSDGMWFYAFESEEDERQALFYSHLMLIVSSEIVINHFGLNDKDKIMQKNSDIFDEVWNKRIYGKKEK